MSEQQLVTFTNLWAGNPSFTTNGHGNNRELQGAGEREVKLNDGSDEDSAVWVGAWVSVIVMIF